ncbi:adenosylcobinamide-GDP ribazoletransferase [Acidimangrovimonas pyrenivorans]|uniref:Adenosylcobinamide-GDP ribazoletransferase n=1 Tax=Acidimangrovimonas pyrenivorans TaxID=2030798 RepID=A0ABV7AI96_9RHOB
MTLRARAAELQVALMLLTRFPAGRIAGPAPGLAASAWAWPLAGLAVGGLSALVWSAASGLGLSPLVAALLAVAAAVVATGGMHEDGLADLADGCGGRDPARRLEIMRDSRIGSYGVLALILSIGLRAAAMAGTAPGGRVVPALIALAVASRAGMALWARLLPPARSDGLGHGAARIAPGAVAVALGLAGAALLALMAGAAFPLAVALLAGGGAVAAFARSRIGGQTGDVLGAAQQLAEICGWLVLAALT